MDNLSPEISVIIPVYNRENLIIETINSVINQSFENWELIIVDDGSTDGTIAAINSKLCLDNRLRLIVRNRNPKGAPTCRNIGVKNAKADYLVFLDSDDLLAPWCLEERLRFKGYDMVIFNGIDFNPDFNLPRKQRIIYPIADPFNYFLNFFVAWGTANVLWSRNYFINSHKWFEGIKSSQDSLLHLIALKDEPNLIWGNQLPDFFVRIQSGFAKISSERTFDKVINRLKILKVLKIELNDYEYSTYKNRFLIDLFNRIEWLPNDELEKIFSNTQLNEFQILNISKYRIIIYFWIYHKTRNVPIIKSLVYRSRKILLGVKRIEKLREHQEIDSKIYNELQNKLLDFPNINRIIQTGFL